MVGVEEAGCEISTGVVLCDSVYCRGGVEKDIASQSRARNNSANSLQCSVPLEQDFAVSNRAAIVFRGTE